MISRQKHAPKFNPHQFGSPLDTALFARYLPYFENCHRILDIGCGPGVFMEIQKAHGKVVTGIDLDAANVALCKKKGLHVLKSDALTYLRRCRQKFDGIFCSHIIEHLPGPEGVTLIELCARALTPGGVLAVVTPNPQNLRVITSIFWMDISHIRPYPLPLLEKMFGDNGFDIITAESFDHEKWYDLYRKFMHWLRNTLIDFPHFGKHDLLMVGQKKGV